MGTPHNEAKKGDFAKTVLMPGDPLRSKFIAENFLTELKLVNNVRGVQGYTGLYNIYMMEELHSILSLGGGGMNKINLPEEKLARYHNPKYPQDYIQRIDTILRQKDEIIALLEEQNV